MYNDQNTTHPGTSMLSPSKRIQFIDAFRGLIMVLMAIDHVSYFIIGVHYSEYWGRELPTYTSVTAFLTRAITHICAPGFFFLAGMSIVLLSDSRQKASWSDRKIFIYLAKRALVLIALEICLLNFAWLIGSLRGLVGSTPAPGGGTLPQMIHFGILCCMACTFIIAAALRKLPASIVFILGLATMLGSHFIIPSAQHVDTLYSPIMRLLFIAGKTQILEVAYPVMPWLSFVLWGIAFARLMKSNEGKTMNMSMLVAIILLLFFAVARIGFGWGDHHQAPDNSWMSILNVSKYPPSIAFTTLTMGVNLLLLFLFWKFNRILTQIQAHLAAFGRTPLFFYILHVLFYLALGTITMHLNPGYTALYFTWFLSLIVMYPVCLWFGKKKTQSEPDALIRFF